MFSDLYWMIKCYLEERKWYRKWRGGKWAYWHLSIPCGPVWIQGWHKTPCGMSLAVAESYPELVGCEDCGEIDKGEFPEVIVNATIINIDEGRQQCRKCFHSSKALMRKEW